MALSRAQYYEATRPSLLWERQRGRRVFSRRLEVPQAVPRKNYELLDVESRGPRATEVVELLDSIERSKAMLNIRDNWDGEGSPGYSEDTWKRAVNFLLSMRRIAREQFQTQIAAPVISPADQGSIDVFWRNSGRNLLINIPADPMQSASYYGERNPEDTVCGTARVNSERPDLVAWLIG